MSFLFPKDESVYAQVTIPYAAAIPNTGGTHTLGNGDYLRHIRLELGGYGGQIINSAAKTRALGRLRGIEGVSGGEPWSIEVPFILSGAAGTPPDMDPLLQALFGKAPVITASTSVVYELDDDVPGLTLWSFRTAGASVSNVVQRCAWGCVLTEFEIGTSDGELVFRCGGMSAFVVPSANFSGYSAEQKGGLTAFPSEPASPSSTGEIIPGFIGSAVINGVGTFAIDGFSVRGNLNRTLRRAFSKRVATIPGAGVREIDCTIRLFEENTSALNTLRDLQRSKAAFDVDLVFGETAGYTATFELKNVVIPSERLDESGDTWVVEFANSPASMTSVTSKDELKLTLT
jgi:hypothetical protein